MEDSKKKPVMIGIVVACLVLAAVITYMSQSESSTGIESIDPGRMTWLKCTNPDCGAEYEVSLRSYLTFVEENIQGMSAPPMVCEQCGEESVYRAVKCEKCGLVFLRDSVPNDFSDRCPECGFSKIEDKRKQRRQSREQSQ